MRCALSDMRGRSKVCVLSPCVTFSDTDLQALETGFDLVRRANIRSLLDGGTHSKPPFCMMTLLYKLSDVGFQLEVQHRPAVPCRFSSRDFELCNDRCLHIA